jgi:hypothetical protein
MIVRSSVIIAGSFNGRPKADKLSMHTTASPAIIPTATFIIVEEIDLRNKKLKNPYKMQVRNKKKAVSARIEENGLS